MCESKKVFFICCLSLLGTIHYNGFAQKGDSSLQRLAVHAGKVFTWEVQEVKPKGYMMFLDEPYNITNSPRDYISLTVARRYEEERPAFISFTLPDNVTKEMGITLVFSPGLRMDPNIKSIRLSFEKHWTNNHTLTARLWNGFLRSDNGSDSLDIFDKMMTNRQLFIIIYDSSGLHRLAIPLSFFQRQYANLSPSGPRPTYSTGNPIDTALTAKEMQDRRIFDDSSIPSPWEIAGVDDPIRLKHFIKFFRYLMNHNEMERMAQLIIFPQDHVIPKCDDSADFVQNYDQIFDKNLKRVINNQRLDQLFRNSKGVLIGSVPCIWINQIGDDFKITAIINNFMNKKK